MTEGVSIHPAPRKIAAGGTHAIGTKARIDIVTAIGDKNLFAPFLGDDHDTWEHWIAALSALYGLRTKRRLRPLIRECTGRERDTLPKEGFDTALFLTGRRSGKSRTAAVVGAYEAAIAEHHKTLAKGEKGIVAVMAPTRRQSKIVKDYIRAVFDGPVLRGEIVQETGEGFELANGIRIEILAGDWRTVRGHTLIAAVIDEACFFGVEEESRIRSDTELIRAIKPALATVGGKLIAISTPYAKKGWCYSTWKKHFGNPKGNVLVWNCPSRTMNPTLPQSVVDDALEEDRQAAKSEYLGEFREDVAEFLTRSLIEGLVVQGRKELLRRTGLRYAGFVDLSGGRSDDATLAIAHMKERTAVIDKLCRYRPPFNPHEVITWMIEELQRYRIRGVTGDNYAAEFVARAFEGQGVRYTKSAKPKSVLYLELLPRLCSGEIELLDDEALIGQLANLERRTRSGGRDIVDHPQGAHDDLANAVAGVADVVSARRMLIGALR